MDFYDVEVECMAYCYGGSPKFTVEPYGYGEWAKREDVELLIAERDRLAAENAELRKQLDWAQQIVKAQEATSNGTACAEERAAGNGGCGACAWCCSAANATLDALREAVQSDEWIYAKHTDTDGQMERIEDILYPQETTDGE